MVCNALVAGGRLLGAEQQAVAAYPAALHLTADQPAYPATLLLTAD